MEYCDLLFDQYRQALNTFLPMRCLKKMAADAFAEH